MPKRRPHIPLSVKCHVALAQLGNLNPQDAIAEHRKMYAMGELLRMVLNTLAMELKCDVKDLRLDHEPALALREYNPRTGKWLPDANDVRYLIYRSREAHDFKTYRKGDGAKRSDTAEMKHQRRVKRAVERHTERMTLKRRGKKAKSKWPSGRKIQNRPFQSRKKK